MSGEVSGEDSLVRRKKGLNSTGLRVRELRLKEDEFRSLYNKVSTCNVKKKYSVSNKILVQLKSMPYAHTCVVAGKIAIDPSWESNQSN